MHRPRDDASVLEVAPLVGKKKGSVGRTACISGIGKGRPCTPWYYVNIRGNSPDGNAPFAGVITVPSRDEYAH